MVTCLNKASTTYEHITFQHWTSSWLSLDLIVFSLATLLTRLIEKNDHLWVAVTWLTEAITTHKRLTVQHWTSTWLRFDLNVFSLACYIAPPTMMCLHPQTHSQFKHHMSDWHTASLTGAVHLYTHMMFQNKNYPNLRGLFHILLHSHYDGK